MGGGGGEGNDCLPGHLAIAEIFNSMLLPGRLAVCPCFLFSWLLADYGESHLNWWPKQAPQVYPQRILIVLSWLHSS